VILLKNFEKALKSGLYIDYFFKNLCFKFLNNFLAKNLFYFLDKYLAEKMFYKVKSFFTIGFTLISTLKNLQFHQLLKILILVTIQLLLMFFL
jgi:hypothetical protein